MSFLVKKDTHLAKKNALQSFMTGADQFEQPYRADIAEVAYLKAESRGFIPGFELDDWLAAEQECNLS